MRGRRKGKKREEKRRGKRGEVERRRCEKKRKEIPAFPVPGPLVVITCI